MKQLIKDANFLKILSANLLSHIGSGITMIGVPWHLVNQEGGETLYGWAAIASTLILFLISPYVGVLVDRHSRRALHMSYDFTGMLVTAGFALWGIWAGGFANWQLFLIYITGTLYYAFHFPTIFALNQELFASHQYRTLNSLMEVQGQVSAMLAGALGSLLIETWGLMKVLLLDAATYSAAFALIGWIRLPKDGGKGRETAPATATVAKRTFWQDLKEGWAFLRRNRTLFVFFAASFMPFITVMVTNYLFPVYIAKTLHQDASIYALTEVIYAVGAVLAGLTMSPLSRRIGLYNAVLTTTATFTAAMFTVALVPVVSVFLLMKVLLGWGNAGTRINRNTFMMETVPNRLIGRVNGFFQTFGISLRVAFISLFTFTVSRTGASFSLLIMGLALAASVAAIWSCRRLGQPHPKNQVFTPAAIRKH